MLRTLNSTCIRFAEHGAVFLTSEVAEEPL